MSQDVDELALDLHRRRPEERFTGILLELDSATGFTDAFAHLRTGAPCRDRIGLLNVLLAEGLNPGLRKTALVSNDSRDHATSLLDEAASGFLVLSQAAVDEGVASGFEDGGVLPYGLEEEGTDLGVAGVGGRESQVKVRRLIIEPKLEEKKRVGCGRPAGAGPAGGKFVPVGRLAATR